MGLGDWKVSAKSRDLLCMYLIVPRLSISSSSVSLWSSTCKDAALG